MELIYFNIFLAGLLIALVYIGYLQFAALHSEPREVEHEEVHPDNDPVKMVHIERYGLHGKAVRIAHELWNHERNKIQKELNK